MRVIKKDFKRTTIIKPENLDDLWDLKHILDSGDYISARTLRTVEAAKKEKRPVFLKILAEKINFDEEGQALKIAGKIVSGPDDIEFGYHTLRVEPDTIINVEKDWKVHQIKRLNESLKGRGIKVLICVLDEKNADFAIVQEKGAKITGSADNKSGGKESGGDQKQYYSEIIKVLEEYALKVDKIIIAGPGFTKDNVYEIIKKEKKELSKKCVKDVSSVTGETGVNEVIKRGALDRIMNECRLSIETQLIEKFLENLGKDTGLVTYGIGEVKNSVESGAVETLIICDKLVRDDGIEALMRSVEKFSGSVHIIDSNHEAGEKLLGLGGIGAFLRYKKN